LKDSLEEVGKEITSCASWVPTRSVIKVMFKYSTSEIPCPIADEIIRKAILLKIIPIFVLIEKKVIEYI
jgi:hypothetical protein